METGVVISLVAVAISAIGLILSGRKDTRTDAANTAIVQTKLDNLINGVTDIRVELRSMRETVTEHSERLARVEARAQSNTHRLDTIEGKKVSE
ncbi:MAG: hypothetical protein J6S14_20515 [Clostridia bacterium]|nr:hypothetical protein [Clostridia bacterium]